MAGLERRLLQIAFATAGGVPVWGGLNGVILGASAFGAWPGAAADSHVRYLSGLLLGIGVLWWCLIPNLERRTLVVRTLTALVVTGGLARLAGALFIHDPGSMRWTLAMELGVTPALCLWQARIAAHHAKSNPPALPTG